MTNKKNYRKFAVSSMAATAAVAAIAPAVSAAEFEGYSDVQAGDSHYEGIKALTEQGVIHGYEDGSFGINDNVTRQQVAVMLSLALDLETPSDVAGVLEVYSDVDENSIYAEEIAAVTAADIFNGNNGEFNPGDDITREQMATVLVLGLDLVDHNTDGNVDVNLGDVSASHEDRVQIFANLGITNKLDDFNPEEALTRGQFATFLHLSQDVLTATPVVKDVSATNTTTLSLSGVDLYNLNASDITVGGKSVENLKVTSATSATVTLDSAIVPNKDYTVTVDGETFTVAYEFTVNSVSVDTATLDDDTDYQYVTFNVNGQNADIETLIAAGYTVDFKAVDASNTDVTSTFFADPTTGYVADTITEEGNYTVQVTVQKGSSVVVSEPQTIEVRNLQGLATAINDYKLTNSGVAGTQNSTTLVEGETADFTDLNVTASGDGSWVQSGYSVKSSDSGVISVDANGVLTANTSGTATITISYGEVTKSINFTVTDVARGLSEVDPTSSSVTLVKTAAASTTVNFKLYDQYGDLLTGTPTVTAVDPSVATSSNLNLVGDGTGSVDLAYAGNGSENLYFKDASNTTIGSLVVKGTATNTVASEELEIVPSTVATRSDDASLDLNADTTVVYNLNEYTSENALIGSVDLTNYTVKYNADVVTVNNSAATGSTSEAVGAQSLTIVADNPGSTQVALYDDQNILVDVITITVNDSKTLISNVNFKTTTTVTNKESVVNVNDVLSLVEGGADDDIVEGLTLSASSMHEVRINSTNAELYLDLNDDGTFTSVDDDVLGKVTEELASNFTGGAAPVADIFAGHTTAAGESGTIIFKVLDEVGNTIDSTSVSVSVTK